MVCVCRMIAGSMPQLSPLCLSLVSDRTVGQLDDLLHILDDAGMPGIANKYIFNGDFVDRGPKGVEIMCILMALYVAMPGESVWELCETLRL